MFAYYMTQRPPMPGAQPRNDLVEIEELDPTKPIEGVGRAYAKLIYSRPLTDAEISDFELMPDTDSLRKNEEHYKGMTIRFNPILNLWDVWEGEELVASVGSIEEAKAGIDSL
jgi:hypothetical protein